MGARQEGLRVARILVRKDEGYVTVPGYGDTFQEALCKAALEAWGERKP